MNDKITARLGIDTIKRLLKMDRVAGRIFLASYHSDLSSDEIEFALGFCSFTKTQALVPRNKFYAVAWLVGASWGQIADLCHVSRATAQSAVRQLLPSKDRTVLRLRKDALSLEQVSLLKATYDQMAEADPSHVKESSPLIIARSINEIIEQESDKL
jgi:hypothetical protein